MGLGISVTAPLGFLKSRATNKIKSYFNALSSPVPHRQVSVYDRGEQMEVSLFPFEENVYVTFDKSTVTISAKTNSAGPGYHAHVVAMIDDLAAKTGLKVTASSVEDETGYYANRDFSALQDSMFDWLEALSYNVLQQFRNSDYTGLSICMPLEITPATEDHFASYPLGYLNEGYFDRVINAKQSGDRQEKKAVCSQFFIWWDQPMDAAFYKKCALATMWADIQWVPPHDDAETALYDSALACLEKAYEREPHRLYPAQEWMELAALREDTALSAALTERFGPRDLEYVSDLGFMRGNVNCLFANGWRLARPGAMRYEFDEANVWWDDKRTIRASVITVAPKSGGTVDNQALLADVGQDEDYVPYDGLKNKDIAAKIMHKPTKEDGEDVFLMCLLAAYNNQLLILSVYYENPEEKSWAESVCASITA